MKRGQWATQLDALPRTGHPAVMRALVLEAMGVPAQTTYRRCRPGGPWQRVLPGVIVLHNGVVSQRQRIAAALLYAGRNAMVTGAEGCRLHGLRDIANDGRIHVLVPAQRKVHSSGFVVVERTIRLPKPVAAKGLPVSPVPRSVLDACRRMSSYDPCRALLSEAIQRRMTTLHSLYTELDSGSRRGTAIPRRVLGELGSGARSVAEIDAARVWKRSGLPPAQRNGRLLGADGRYIASPDAWCDEVAFAWEIDSQAHHAGTAGFEATLARNARYAAAGIVVLQTLPARLRSEPGAVIRELRAAYRAAEARPRPPVVFQPRPLAA